MGILSNIVKDNTLTDKDVPRLETKLFFDGADQRRNLERFGVLMFFATAIATYGVLGDSTATVIGAMLIAPLMTPIMATAAALVMGQMSRAGWSLLVVAAGVVGAIALSFLIGLSYNSVISVSTNTQIVARTSPRLIDLYAALAAGAVGAFAMSREDVADTLPGAAIAIALVPPLAVVGVTLSVGAWSDAWGAMLLFLTNFFAILLAGGGVLALFGLGRAATTNLHGRARRNAFYAIAVGTFIVAIPLAVTSANIALAALTQSATTRATKTWVSPTEYDVAKVKMAGDSVKVVLAGEGDLPPTSDLIAALQKELPDGVIVDLEVLPSQNLRLVIEPSE